MEGQTTSSKWHKKLTQWQQADLLTPEQVDAIDTFEAKSQKSETNWWLISLMALGALVLSLGLLSLVAANWAHIPRLIKLMANFGLLITMAVLIFIYRPRGGFISEALITAFFIMCLVTIGLTSQIYHVSGQWYYALLLWSAICFPLILFCQQSLAPFIWLFAFLPALSASVFTPLFEANAISEWKAIMPPALFITMASATAMILSHKISILARFATPSKVALQCTGLVALISFDLIHSGAEQQHINQALYWPGISLSVLVIIFVLWWKGHSSIAKGILLAAIVLFILNSHPDFFYSGLLSNAKTHETATAWWQTDDIRSPVITLTILLLLACYAGIQGYTAWFNTLTFLIGARFVVLYLQAIGGLYETGIGLIVSGFGIMLFAWLWYRSRKFLQRWIQRVAK